MKKKIITISLLTFSCISHAGLNGLTQHSRANCVNNESISWDATDVWYLETKSWHTDPNKKICLIETGKQMTQRSAAVHWGEGTGGWRVSGEHFILDKKTGHYIRYKGTYS